MKAYQNSYKNYIGYQYSIGSDFKVITLAFRCIHGLSPSYLEECIILKKPRRQGIRSEDLTKQPEIPRLQDTHLQLDHLEKRVQHYGIKYQNISET